MSKNKKIFKNKILIFYLATPRTEKLKKKKGGEERGKRDPEGEKDQDIILDREVQGAGGGVGRKPLEMKVVSKDEPKPAVGEI